MRLESAFHTTTRLFTIVLAALLVGCASPTAYQPYSLTGGYKDRPVGVNRYYVEFQGNGFTTRDTVFAYWLYHCAELTRDKGFDYFVFISKTPPSGASLDPGVPDRVYARGGGGYTPIYIYNPPHSITTWHAHAVIELLNGAPSEDELAHGFVAKALIEALGPAVHEAMVSGKNVTLPPRFAAAPNSEDPKEAARPADSGPVKMEDLDALLPK